MRACACVCVCVCGWVGGWMRCGLQLKNAHLVRNKRLLRGGSGSVHSWRRFPGRVAACEACPQGPHQNLPRFMKTVIVRGASSVPEQGRARYRKKKFFPIERNRLHQLDAPPLAPTHLRSKRNGGCCNGRSSPTPLNPTSDRNFGLRDCLQKNRVVLQTDTDGRDRNPFAIQTTQPSRTAFI